MVSPDGEVLGTHQGYFGFTVGQRKGLGLSRPAEDGRPRYVIETRPATNEVVVGPEELLSRTAVDGDGLVLLADPEPLAGSPTAGTTDPGGSPAVGWQEAGVQVRAHGRPVPARVRIDAERGLLHAELGTPLRGVAAGQSLVIYGGDDGDRVLAQATVASAQVPSHLTSRLTAGAHRAERPRARTRTRGRGSSSGRTTPFPPDAQSGGSTMAR